MNNGGGVYGAAAQPAGDANNLNFNAYFGAGNGGFGNIDYITDSGFNVYNNEYENQDDLDVEPDLPKVTY